MSAPSDPQAGERLVTWADVHRDTRALVGALLPLGPWTGIVALARGGLVPAAIVAREMGLRTVDTLCIASYDERDRGELAVLKAPAAAMTAGGAGWLLIDDLVDTGRTALKARELMPEIHIATVYAKPEGRPATDTFIHEVPQDVWVVFPWDAPPLVSEHPDGPDA